MSDNERQDKLMAVLDAIPWGKSNAVIADEIQAIAGTEKEWRTQLPTRELIRDLRLQGHPICSSSGGLKGEKGYWLTTDRVELLVTIESMKHRAAAIQAVAAALRKTYEDMGGERQMEIF